MKTKVTLAEIAMTLKNSSGFGSDFFLGHNNSCTLLLFGEEIDFEIANECELWLFNATFDSTPSFGGYVLFDQLWMLHGCKKSGKASVQCESWSAFYVLFAAGQGNHKEQHYTEAINLVFDAGKKL